MILQQAKAALWLLTHFGGVGSKSRKGFGSFADIAAEDVAAVDLCRQAAAAFRRACGCDGPFQEQWAESLALGQMLAPSEVQTPWKDYWFALDQLGYAAQRFAQDRRHNKDKAALGLPRQIHGPRPDPLPGQQNHRRPQQLANPRGTKRFASSVLYHLGKAPDGTFTVRVAAFPARHLPDLATSTAVLTDLLVHLRDDLAERSGRPGPDSPVGPGPVAGRSSAPAARRPAVPKAGDLLEAVLIEDPKGKGRRFARHEPSGLAGNILNPDQLPADKKPGDGVTLRVHYTSSDGKTIQFRVPTGEDEQRRQAPRRGPPPRGPQRRR